MNQTFVVEVIEKPDITPEGSVESLSRAFNISERKIELMLKRLPGVATKPISEQEAAVVVTYFEQAGLKAVVKSVTLPSSTGSSTSTVTTSTTPAPTHNTVNNTASNTSTTKPYPEPKPYPERPRSEPTPRFEIPLGSEIATSSEIAKSRLESFKTATPKYEPPNPQTSAKPAAQPAVIQPVQAETKAKAPATFSEAPFSVAELLSQVSTSRTAVAEPTPVTEPPPAPKNEPQPEHDILRNTLIGEPDLRNTQDLYTSSVTLPGLANDRTSSRLGNRLLLTAVLPTLLALIGCLAVTYLMVQPALYEHLNNSARHPAVAIAAGLSSVLSANPRGDIDAAKLQGSIEATRTAFAGQGLHFIAVTDRNGEFLPASWFASSAFMTSADVRDNIQAQATKAVNAEKYTPSFVPLNLGAETVGAESNASQLEVVAQPLYHAGQPVGAVVVGVTSRAVQSNIWRILGSVALFSLIPLALASLLAILGTRPITRRVAYLTQRANDISRGNLSQSVELRGRDELSELAEALERLRVSMQSALARLRRRR